jgi:hypothetical protein
MDHAIAHLAHVSRIALALWYVVSAQTADGQESTGDPLVLEPALAPGGYATARFALTTGQIVQLSSGCSEWAGGGMGFLATPPDVSEATAVPRFVTFHSGPAFEIDGYLIVESRHQIGSDGTDEPLSRPLGCAHILHDATGSIYCTQVLAIDLSSGALRSVGGDTFAPVGTPGGEYVVVAEASGDTHPWEDGRQAGTYYLWNPGEERLATLGTADEFPGYRVAGREVFLSIVDGAGRQVLGVDTVTGSVRALDDGDTALAADSFVPTQPPNLVARPPEAWQTSSGRPIRVETNWGGRPRLEPPSYGGCGVSGPYWWHDLLFCDEGAFYWPEGLSVE